MIPILYGSQTGSAIYFAKLLQARIGGSAFVLPMDSFDALKLLDAPFVVFMCSTHGDGQCPFNMAAFWDAMASDIPPVFRFQYAVLGLGDSSYPKYNWCARMLHGRLEQLGATPVLKVLANVQAPGGLYDGYYAFEKSVLELLTNTRPEAQAGQEVPDMSKPADAEKVSGVSNTVGDAPGHDPSAGACTPSGDNKKGELPGAHNKNDLNGAFTDSTSKDTVADKNRAQRATSSRHRASLDNASITKESCEIPKRTYKATVVSNKLATRDGYKKQVREILFSIPEYDSFYPGDCIGIHPHNRRGIAAHFGLSSEEQEFVEKNVDLNGVPQQAIFKELAALAANSQAREKLEEISRDFDLYYSYAAVPKRNIVEILEDFKIVPSIGLLSKLERIYPRYYSCSRIDGLYSILVSMVDFKTYLASPRKGLCSEYLKTLDGSIDVEVVRSRLFMNDKNLLFFATGSGITLPRSAAHFFSDKTIKIFYGFRSRENDFLCANEFGACELHCAASVDDGRYVMDAYRENAVGNADDWLIFVSGNCRLNKEIRALLREVHGKDVVFQSETW